MEDGTGCTSIRKFDLQRGQRRPAPGGNASGRQMRQPQARLTQVVTEGMDSLLRKDVQGDRRDTRQATQSRPAGVTVSASQRATYCGTCATALPVNSERRRGLLAFAVGPRYLPIPYPGRTHPEV